MFLLLGSQSSSSGRSDPFAVNIKMISYKHTVGFRWYRILLVTAISGAVLGSPVPKTTYDQTQQGELNVRADLDNIVVLFVPSGGIRLVDNQQIGNILQLFSNSRKNYQSEASSASVHGASNDSPYKVDVEQSAIDRLQSDVDSLNTVIPIMKNYGLEKKNNDDKISMAPEDISSTEAQSIPIQSTEEQSTRESETSKSSTQDATTVESIVTSQPITQKVDKKEPTDNENKDNVRVKTTSKNSAHKEDKPTSASISPNKAHQKVSAQPFPQRSHQNVRPAAVPASAKRSEDEEDRLAKRLRTLQSGITYCSPGEMLADNGDCVKIHEKTTDRERRQEKMDRLLELLKFGLEPADGSQ